MQTAAVMFMWLLVAVIALVSCDTLNQVSTIPMHHAGYTIFTDNSVWYRSTKNTLVKGKNELPIPIEMRPYEVKIINATGLAVLHTYNLTSIPFYWTDGKKEMEKFDQLKQYQGFNIADMQYLDTRGKDYVVATIFHARTNLYKIIAICLQTKETAELITTSRSPTVKLHQPTGVFYFVY